MKLNYKYDARFALVHGGFLHLIVTVLCLVSRVASAEEKFDVVVYGGTPAGATAAVAAANEGAVVALLEPGQHLGGVVSGGLGHTDIGNPDCIGGLSREFFERIGKHYGEPLAWYFEPHVAEKVFADWLAEAEVRVFYGHRLAESDKAVTKKGARIDSITIENGSSFSAKFFVDASYEGDLMAQAGVSYVIGREGREEYNEPLAGVQPVPLGDLQTYKDNSPPHGPGYSSLMFPTVAWYKKRPNYLNTHQWPVNVSGVDRYGRLLPGVTGRDPGKPGAGDKKFMAYNFRLCLTDRKENRIPIERPPGYSPHTYELLRRYIELWPDIKLGQIFHIARMPGSKSDFNTSGPYSTDYLGANWDYPEASYSRRQEIWEDHKNFIQGMFYFLAKDERLPQKLRAEAATWGLSKDEFADTEHWPRQLYVRVARRMHGEAFMTQKDVESDVVKDDSVAMGSFVIDSHNVQRVVTQDGFVVNEGGVEVPVTPYQIPYGVLVPKKAECENLLVPVCISASYIAYCTLRMEPVYMALGHASGLAAAAALSHGTAVQEVDVAKLKADLLRQNAVIGLNNDKLHPLFQRELDDIHAKLIGQWKVRCHQGGDGFYRHDMNAGKGAKTARWRLLLPRSNQYDVQLTCPTHPNNATSIRVKIVHAKGNTVVTIDQRRASLVDNGFLSLGVFHFVTEKPAEVVVDNEETDGHVIIDKVRFTPVLLQ